MENDYSEVLASLSQSLDDVVSSLDTVQQWQQIYTGIMLVIFGGLLACTIVLLFKGLL